MNESPKSLGQVLIELPVSDEIVAMGRQEAEAELRALGVDVEAFRERTKKFLDEVLRRAGC